MSRVMMLCACSVWRRLSCGKFDIPFQRAHLSSRTQTSRSTGRTS